MDDGRSIPEIGSRSRSAAEALRRLTDGDVSTSPFTRWLYSTDASSYRAIPDIVLVARSVGDLHAAAFVAAEHGLPLVARGAGTSLAGQAIGPGIMVDCFRLDRIISIDPDRRTARVEPGVIQASLNRAAAPFELEFGPDTSTVEQATIGGMVGNNSSGSRSIIYGESKDKVRRVAAVLAGGDAFVFGPSSASSLGAGLYAGNERASSRAFSLVGALDNIRSRFGPAIRDGYGEVRRCTSGYNLRELLRPAPNLGRLLAGSEGTLALFAELEIALDPKPRQRVGAALSFPDLRRALEANVPILATGPSAVELLDLDPLRRASNLEAHAAVAGLLEGDQRGLLLVEYQGSEEEARDGLQRLRSLVPNLAADRIVWLETPDALAAAAALRRAVLPLLMSAPGAERPVAFVEDTAVSPERLAAFAGDFEALVAAHGLRASFSGHASAGCLHVRPLLDLKTAAGVARLDALSREVAGLVAEYRGVISGEHGCGRSRSYRLPDALGPELYEAMVALKDAFDPDRLMGPGVVVDAAPITEGLRFATRHPSSDAWRPRLSYQAEGGFNSAVERCFGAGLCKKTSGTMCPPAAPGRDEMLSTRARANALQGVMMGAIPLGQIGEDEFREVLGSCLACKACKTECPAGVDMATLKVEWLAEVRAKQGMPLLARVAGNFRELAAVASPAAPALNLIAGTSIARRVAGLAGVARERPLPTIAGRPLTKRLVRASDHAGQAALFVDCFVQYQEPGIGESLASLLRLGGVELTLIEAGCCGRTALSTGQIDKARSQARRALTALYEHASAGVDLLVIEPSCLAMMRDDWRRLLPDDERVNIVAEAARPALAAVADLADEGLLRFRPGGAALLHSHCHEKALSFSATTERALRAVPELRLQVLDAGCCGMSGVFGYEADHFETSTAVAERVLLPAVRSASSRTAVLATGTSCRRQIEDLTGRHALHPLEFLAERVDVDS